MVRSLQSSQMISSIACVITRELQKRSQTSNYQHCDATWETKGLHLMDRQTNSSWLSIFILGNVKMKCNLHHIIVGIWLVFTRPWLLWILQHLHTFHRTPMGRGRLIKVRLQRLGRKKKGNGCKWQNITAEIGIWASSSWVFHILWLDSI